LPRKNSALPDDEALKLEIKETLVRIMREAKKEFRRISHECEFHPNYTGNGRGYKHQINVVAEDKIAVLKACAELWDRIDGKAATRKEAPKLKTSGRSLDELTDEELEQIILQGEEQPEEET
jgi:hypothetical protein